MIYDYLMDLDDDNRNLAIAPLDYVILDCGK